MIESQTSKSKFSVKSLSHDFYISCLSRELSRMVRQEVLNGRAKFGSGAAGKEVVQVAMAHAFQPGDFLSGYYRDQTIMLAKEMVDAKGFFAFLYGDSAREPFAGGRQMNNSYGTPLIDELGQDLKHTERHNVVSVISAVAAQAPRALGLALASQIYRQDPALDTVEMFSRGGDEICFCTIGDASTSEGAFLETVNAAGLLQVPLAIFIYDDGYGISVPTRYQTTKGSISAALEGFRYDHSGQGLDIYKLKAWDYPNLRTTISRGIAKIRKTHIPAIFHIEECTQPYGHSTSGSHERYKSQERLQWEEDMDGITKMADWLQSEVLLTEKQIKHLQKKAKAAARSGRDEAWSSFTAECEECRSELATVYDQLGEKPERAQKIEQQLRQLRHPVRSHILDNARKMQFALGDRATLTQWIDRQEQLLSHRYSTHLYSESSRSALLVPEVTAEYDSDAPPLKGFEILNHFFDAMLAKYPQLCAFGEDVGVIGDVNQGFAGLQKKYGESRVFDTGIREWSIVGQAIGLAMRGIRPIAEIQYLDYLAYALAPLTDDLATLRYRSNGQQKCPAIIRTRGHRLEGIWHSGSPIGMLLHSMRGIYVLVPRNMTQAAGMYHTMLQSDDPAIVIECLNGYRLKERLPSNLSTFTVPLGQPEILQSGQDLTLVTYGSCVRIAIEALEVVASKGVSVELIDVQTLLPFDRTHTISKSLQKTNRILFLDEDVPGGASAYMMQQVLENQEGFRHLDAAPQTLTSRAHRPAFGDDGDYTTKPNANDVITTVLAIVRE